MITLLYLEDGSHEFLETETGLELTTKTLVKEGVSRIYFAKNKTDAELALQHFQDTVPVRAKRKA